MIFCCIIFGRIFLQLLFLFRAEVMLQLKLKDVNILAKFSIFIDQGDKHLINYAETSYLDGAPVLQIATFDTNGNRTGWNNAAVGRVITSQKMGMTFYSDSLFQPLTQIIRKRALRKQARRRNKQTSKGLL